MKHQIRELLLTNSLSMFVEQMYKNICSGTFVKRSIYFRAANEENTMKCRKTRCICPCTVQCPSWELQLFFKSYQKKFIRIKPWIHQRKLSWKGIWSNRPFTIHCLFILILFFYSILCQRAENWQVRRTSCSAVDKNLLTTGSLVLVAVLQNSTPLTVASRSVSPDRVRSLGTRSIIQYKERDCSAV